MTISRNQLRAARMLLCLSQDELATLSRVGVATIRRYEAGRDVGAPQIEVLKAAVEAAGAVLLGATDVAGRRIGDGVALAAEGDLPDLTRDRLRDRAAGAEVEGPRRPGRPTKQKA